MKSRLGLTTAPPVGLASQVMRAATNEIDGTRADIANAHSQSAVDKALSRSNKAVQKAEVGRVPARELRELKKKQQEIKSFANKRKAEIADRRRSIAERTSVRLPTDLVVSGTQELRLGTPMSADELKPSTAYTYKKTVYVTDASARVAYISGIVAPPENSPGIRKGHEKPQREARLVGETTDSEGPFDGGHGLAISLGGFPSGPNLFPQDRNMNRSAFRSFERALEHAHEESDGDVTFEMRFADNAPGDDVPAVVLLTLTTSEGTQEFSLLNEAHQFKGGKK